MKYFNKLLKTGYKIVFPWKHLSKRNKSIILGSAFVVVLIMIPILFYILKYATGAFATSETFTTTGDTTWVAPAGVYSVQIEAWGAGSNGAAGGGGLGGSGGGGGAYSKTLTYSTTPGNSYTVHVGASGASGGDTYFVDSSTTLAKGASTSTGGQSSSSVGDVKYSGGNGGTNGGFSTGGGGGGSAGGASIGGNGGNGSGSSGGSAGSAGTSGGAVGGTGGIGGSNGKNGFSPGAGGGGAPNGGSAGSGANGKVILTYTITNPQDTVSWWKFNEGTGNVASNSASTNGIGGLLGATKPSWQTKDLCVSDKCLFFNGTTSYVSVTDNSAYTWSDEATLSTWFRTSDKSATRTLVGKAASASTREFNFSLETDGRLRCWFSSIGSTLSTLTYSPTKDYADGKWHNAQCVYNGSTITVYVDGVAGASQSFSGNIFNSSSALEIGHIQEGAANWYWNGFIDEVKVYNYARSTAQIKADTNQYANVLGTSTTQNLSNGLVGYWKMDEASWTGNCSTTSVTDSSGVGINGKACPNASAPSPTVAKFGNGAVLDGIDDYIEIADNAALDPSNAVTVSMWFKPNQTLDVYQAILGKGGGAAFEKGYEFANNNGAFGFWVNGASQMATTTTPANGDLAHWVGTYDGSTIKLYKNGSLVSTVSYTGTITDTSLPFRIGRPSEDGGNDIYAAAMYDEVRVYNRALSPAEVQQLYNFAPGPVAYYNFEEKQGISVNDSSSYGNNGIMSGATWTNGKYGSAGNFDGNNDQVSVSDSDSISLTNDMTLEAWVKPTDFANYNGILGKTTVGAVPQPYDFYIVQTTGIPRLLLGNGTIFGLKDGTRSLTTGVWQHITVTKNGNTVTHYLDGVENGTGTVSTTITDGGQSLLIGNRADSVTDMKGGLDEVKIYNYARTPVQIIEDMNANHPAPGSPVGSPVGYWKLNEGYGSVTYNSGNMATVSAALTSTAWTNNGKFGKSLSFDGAASYASTPKIPAFYPQEVTSTAWIYPTSVAHVGNVVSASGNSSWRYRINTTGTITFFDRGATNAITTTDTVPLNQWSHVAVVGSLNGLRIYINSRLVKSNSTAYGGAVPAGGNLVIGASDISNMTENFTGKIDEVKVFNSALTPAQLKLDYNQGQALVLGAISDTSGLTGGSLASNSASSVYCVPGDTTACSSPVAEWNFEEGYGSSVSDNSGNNLVGTLQTGAAWTNGKIGKGMNLNGTSAYVSVTDNNLLDITGDITLEQWVYPINNGLYQPIISKNSTGEYEIAADFRAGANDFDLATRWAGTSTNFTDFFSGYTDQWVHITVTVSGTTVKAYRNGIYIGSAAGAVRTASINDVNMGRRPGASFWWNGKIDQVKIFNYERSAAQVAWDYNNGKPVGWWKMDECQGSTLHDSSGKGLSASLTVGVGGTSNTIGTCTTASTAWYAGSTGKYNSSIDLDGTDDYATISYNPILYSNEISSAAWIYPRVNQTGNIVAANGNTGWRYRINSGGTISFLDRGATNNITTTDTLTFNQWSHITVVGSSSGLKIYINGRLSKSNAVAYGAGDPASGSVLLGALSSVSELFAGALDDIRIYNYALTAAQIKTIYNQDSAVRYGPLTGTP